MRFPHLFKRGRSKGGAPSDGHTLSPPPPPAPSPPPLAPSPPPSPAVARPPEYDAAAAEDDCEPMPLAPTTPAPTPLLPSAPADACVAPVLTRQDLRALGIVQGEDGRLAVQRTARSSSKGKQAAVAAMAVDLVMSGSGLGGDPRAVLQALGAVIRVR